ncbi:hypothetical protein CPLU01_16122, partial [Colletotrichum plurivorum]
MQPATLLDFLYGYDAGTTRQPQFGVRKVTLGNDALSRTVHVPDVWSLMIGSVITFSPLSSEEMLGDNILFDQKALSSTHGIHTVRVIDEQHKYRYHIVVDQDYDFVAFLRHATALSQPDDSNATAGYVLVGEHGKLVDSALWLEPLTSGDIENHIFRLRKREALKTGREEQDIQVLSTRHKARPYYWITAQEVLEVQSPQISLIEP